MLTIVTSTEEIGRIFDYLQVQLPLLWNIAEQHLSLLHVHLHLNRLTGRHFGFFGLHGCECGRIKKFFLKKYVVKNKQKNILETKVLEVLTAFSPNKILKKNLRIKILCKSHAKKIPKNIMLNN